MSNQAYETKPVALITGAGSGLGLDLAKQLATSHHLVLIDVQLDRLQAQTAHLSDVTCIHCDLANEDSIASLVKRVSNLYPRLDILVNNAGITHRSLAQDTHLSVIRQVMAVDYFAPVQLTQGLIPLLGTSATIVNIGSMAGWMPVLGRAGYCAAKSALHQYFETLRAELSGNGVSVLMVYPSFLDTPIERNALDGQGGRARHKRSMVGKMRSSEWMAKRIAGAISTREERLFPDRFTRWSSLLYRLFPRVYLRLMRKRLAAELQRRSP